jgi:hypothetical protein
MFTPRKVAKAINSQGIAAYFQNTPNSRDQASAAKASAALHDFALRGRWRLALSIGEQGEFPKPEGTAGESRGSPARVKSRFLRLLDLDRGYSRQEH